MLNFFRKFRRFINHPTRSRTTGLLAILILVSAVFLTVNIAQQQQTVKQHAEGYNCGGLSWPNPDLDCISYADECNDGLCRGNSGNTNSCQKVPKNLNGSCQWGAGTCDSNGYCDLKSQPPLCVDWLCKGDGNECHEGKCIDGACRISYKSGTPCNGGNGSCNSSSGNCDSNPATHTCAEGQCGTYPNCRLCCTEAGLCDSGKGYCIDCSNPIPTTNPILTDTCTSNGGRCIPMAPCVPPANANYSYSCGDNPGGAVCCTSCWNQTACPMNPDDYLGYRNRMTDGKCESDCGETSNTSSLCYDPACTGAKIPTKTPTPTVQNPTTSPCPPVINPTSPPHTSPAPGSPTPTTNLATITLVSALNAQDVSLTADTITTTIILYSLSTNTVVSDAPATQIYSSTSIPGKQYSATITLANLFLNEKYFVVIRYNNMIAKTVFAVTSSTRTITAPTTTLVFGDINNDDDINIADFNLLRSCWKNPATGVCTASDFNQTGGNVDEVDYNIWLRGLVTWSKEAQEL